jgi:Ca2+-transporting ATPase
MEEVYVQTLDEVFSNLDSKTDGLTSPESAKRLETFGLNKIKKKKKLKLLKIFFSQFNSFLIYILLIAAAISFSIGHMVDAFVIAGIVLLNAIIGSSQQFKAENAIRGLRKLIISKSRVIRDGKQIEIPSENLVPGDIVLFEAGDKVNADCRLIESENLEANEAVLTGESLPVSKKIGELKSETSLAHRNNMLFTGTSITRGTGKGIIVATGMKTVFGEIAENLQEIETTKTPMQKRLDTFSKQIGFIILGLVAIIAALGFLEKFDLIEMFLTAVALAVSAIPEGLPAVLTIGFAISSLLMSKKNVIVRRLPAVESLGSVTVICSDKTGTLTEEKMTAEEIFVNNQFLKRKGKDIFFNNKKLNIQKSIAITELIKTSVLCNNARFEIIGNKYQFIGDPTENALVEEALELGINKKTLIEAQPSVEKFEFDSERKMMSIARQAGNKTILYSKGATIKILEASNKELIGGEVIKLTVKRKKELLQRAAEMESKAYRVLAFAQKNCRTSRDLSEDGLTFIGMIGMIDPPRMEVKPAIQECRDAGIKVKIITGDSPLTAKAIAEKIGITGRVVAEDELRTMTDEELESQIHDISIFARMTPQQKLRITQMLQKMGETVAITGDGVNDVLALKSADVGVAMGIRGSDVTRDVADIVLIDDNFTSIVEGVRQGRVTYDNVKKFTKYLLAVNFAEIFLVLFALIFGMPLPLTALQILWINLVSDSFPSLTLAFEKGHGVMKEKPRNEKSILSGIWKYLIIAGLFAFVAKLSIFLIGINNGLPIEEVRTMVLTAAIMYELLFVYTVRSRKSLKEIGIFSNKWLNVAVIGSLILHVILIYSPLGRIFDLVPLSFMDWLCALPIALSGVVAFEIYKLIRDRKKEKSEK